MRHEREIRYKKFQNFIDRFYVKTSKSYDSDSLEVEDPGFDCYICATDVIWKYHDIHGFDRGYFLASSCMENKRKIAYASSRGPIPVYTPEQEATLFYYLDDFDYLSVREESLKYYLETHSNMSVELVLDPVLLHDRSFYNKLAINPQEDRYILLYYVMEQANDIIKMAVEYARLHNVKIVELNDFPDSTRLDNYDGIDKTYRYDVGVEEWLGYIRGAERVFTNSFHMTCLSILFGKKFYVGKRNGDKVTNLLSETGLSSRRVSSSQEIERLDSEEIKYESVYQKLAKLRKNSKQYIISAINECSKEPKKPREDYEWWKRSRVYPLYYACAGGDGTDASGYVTENGEITHLDSGEVAFLPRREFTNNGFYRFGNCRFFVSGKHFIGWKLKVKVDNRYFWCAEDDGQTTLVANESKDKAKLFSAGEPIPFIPVNRLAEVVAVSEWSEGEMSAEPNPFEPPFHIIYHSSGSPSKCNLEPFKNHYGDGEFITPPSGNVEYRSSVDLCNNGTNKFADCGFSKVGCNFTGWRLRIRIGKNWFWCNMHGGLIELSAGAVEAAVFRPGEFIPYIAVERVDSLVAEAVWESLEYGIRYNSGKTKSVAPCKSRYRRTLGKTQQLPSGSTEFTPHGKVINSGRESLLPNRFSYRGETFVGWRMRIKERGQWYWVLADGLLESAKQNLKPNKYRLFGDCDTIPRFADHDIDIVVVEAV